MVIVLNFSIKHGSLAYIHAIRENLIICIMSDVPVTCFVTNVHHTAFTYIIRVQYTCVCGGGHSLLQGSPIIDMNKTSVFGRLKILFVVFPGDLPNLTWKHTAISSRNKYRSDIGRRVYVCVCVCVVFQTYPYYYIYVVGRYVGISEHNCFTYAENLKHSVVLTNQPFEEETLWTLIRKPVVIEIVSVN